ncbi:MAG: orange carotenoid protein N-terminal domain-containing protein [Synechococcales bacterium]|nr:orange carotenoid protein N-terminal domain-containing protein [Synechococcales bacterium]
MTAAMDKLMQFLSDEERAIAQDFDSLETDPKLALFYYIYEKMGDSITPAAPTAAEPELAPVLLGDFYQLSKDDQLTAMRDIVNCADTDYSRYYGALSENNRLMVWYAWARAMGDTVVDMPDDYEATENLNQILQRIENLDFQDQISVLRAIAAGMGHSDVQSTSSRAEVGTTDSL